MCVEIDLTVGIIILCSVLILIFIAVIVPSSKTEATFFSYFPSSFNASAAKKIIDEAGHYVPPWWYSPDLGTIIAFGKDYECVYDEEIVEAADGCRFIVSWYPHRPYNNADLDNVAMPTYSSGDQRMQIVLYVPGLGLHADSKVSKNYALRMSQQGYVVGIVGVRGERLPLTCHSAGNQSAKHAVLRPWHPALIDDLLATILRIHKLLPVASKEDTLDLFLTGYSAGGNIVQKTLQAIHQQSICKHHAHHWPLNMKNEIQSKHDGDSRVTSCTGCQSDEQQLVRAAFVLCLNFHYIKALRRLEETLMGKIYSFFMRRVSTDILKKHRSELLQYLEVSQSDNQQNKEKILQLMGELFPSDTEAQATLATFQLQWLWGGNISNESGDNGLLSDFDARVWRLRGFHSAKEQFSAFSMFEVSAIAVPTLLLQPRDDPLHLKNALDNLDLSILKKNPSLLLMSPRCGNHFGFYEGSLWQAICGTNEECYSYPAKVSASFFDSALQQYLGTSTSNHTNNHVKEIRELQLQELLQHELSECVADSSVTTTAVTTTAVKRGRDSSTAARRSRKSRSRSKSRSRVSSK